MNQGWKIKLLHSHAYNEDTKFVALNYCGKLVQTIGSIVENKMMLNFWEGVFVLEGGRGEMIETDTEEDLVRNALGLEYCFKLFPFYRLRSLGFVINHRCEDIRLGFPDKRFKKSKLPANKLKFVSIYSAVEDPQVSPTDDESQYICVDRDIQHLFYSIRNVSSFL